MFNNSAKKTFTLLCTLLLALVFIGTSCKKDDEKTSKDYLTAHDWKLTSVKIGGIASTLDDCDKDDSVTFHDDGEYHSDEGATKCEPTDPQETTGTWSISSSTTPETLTIKYDDGGTQVTEEYDITELTDSRMVLSIEVPLFGTIVNTFEKK